MKYYEIPDEAFQHGTNLIIFKYFDPSKKQVEKKNKIIEDKELLLLTNEFISEEEYDQHLKYYDYKMVLKCPYCDGYIKTSAHLKKHNIFKEEFVAQYGGISPVDIVANKILKWYKPNTNKWAIQQPGEPSVYFTYTTEKQKQYNLEIKEKCLKDGTRPIYYNTYLSREIIKKHLRYSSMKP